MFGLLQFCDIVFRYRRSKQRKYRSLIHATIFEHVKIVVGFANPAQIDLGVGVIGIGPTVGCPSVYFGGPAAIERIRTGSFGNTGQNRLVVCAVYAERPEDIWGFDDIHTQFDFEATGTHLGTVLRDRTLACHGI